MEGLRKRGGSGGVKCTLPQLAVQASLPPFPVAYPHQAAAHLAYSTLRQEWPLDQDLSTHIMHILPAYGSHM